MEACPLQSAKFKFTSFASIQINIVRNVNGQKLMS